MKLTYFSIQDYRSIAKATLQGLQTTVILIGPNNEGKSNVLQGLNACLSLLQSGQTISMGAAGQIKLPFGRNVYDWSTDFPVPKQLKNPTGESVFELHFQLSESEKSQFHEATGSKINEALPIELRLGPNYASFKVLKQGRGGAALSRKPGPIGRFVSSTLDFVYIPAVRAADVSLRVVDELVSRELRRLERIPEYAELRKQLQALQEPVLVAVSDRLRTTLQSFLGSTLKKVSIALPDRFSYRRLGQNSQVTIDDGTPTLLERKGDGVKSLVAISLMIGVLQDSASDKDTILLIEEPESHLHPRAIHQLRETLDALREENQLIITTHCPLFVNRADVSANVIVSKNKATPAKSLAELRDVLGVRASDNLQHAALVIVVEGAEDEIGLRALLSYYSTSLASAFTKGSLAFNVLRGASKLVYALSLLQSSLCNYYVVLDDDEEGRKAFREAQLALLASAANTSFTKCEGLPEAEFEDLLNEEVYADYFLQTYSVNVRQPPFNSRQKWSQRIAEGLKKAGKSSATGEAWPASEKQKDKHAIAELVAKAPGTAVLGVRESVVRSIALALEARLSSLSVGPTRRPR